MQLFLDLRPFSPHSRLSVCLPLGTALDNTDSVPTVVGAVDVLSEVVISAVVAIAVVLGIVSVAVLAMVVVTVDVVSGTTATVDVEVVDVLTVTVLPAELVDSMVGVLVSAAWLVVVMTPALPATSTSLGVLVSHSTPDCHLEHSPKHVP